MNDTFSSLSSQAAHAVEQAAASVVQVYARRRPVAGLVVAEDLVLTPARHIDDDAVVVRRGDGQTAEGTVMGRSPSTGLAVIRVPALGVPPARPAAEPRVGHLAVAVGRTWSGGPFAILTSIAVIGGPLRTGRTTELPRVIRTAASPHGALVGGALADADGGVLGIITSAAIRGTTVVIPMDLAVAASAEVSAHGGGRQGFLGVSSVSVPLPARQRGGLEQGFGLLVTSVVEGSPAEKAGVLIGDIIVSFDGEAILSPEQLVMRLRGKPGGAPTPLAVLRGGTPTPLEVTVGERRR
ncbi:MAG: S1C family serine protease [Vicinamibacterales bacterium]